ncbi:unnamed protein product [Mytilus coruscus]|uniref:Uncharacterized protein n=1 Tax=Mytilus coruscus TaxID=42192 RepID=A0A6J8ARW6_MYTCO|nr:unnamed protein product [Mytilus coruscus]
MINERNSRSVQDSIQNKTQCQKSYTRKKKHFTTKHTNKSRRRKLSPNVLTYQTKETSKQFPYIRSCLSFNNPNTPRRVSSICCVDQNTLWIGQRGYGGVMKVTYNSAAKILTIVKEFMHSLCEFYDFCYDLQRDQLLYMDKRNHSTMCISSKYQRKKFKSVKPLKPTCITISPDDFTFVGFVDEYTHLQGS